MGGFQSRLCRLEYLCSQAILQAASWPSPSFHKYTGGPTRYHAENRFYPLKAGAWAHALCNHPDQLFVAVLLDGVQRPELILGGGRHFSPPGLVLVQQFLILRLTDFHLFSDASGSWGCGALFGSQWFQSPAPLNQSWLPQQWGSSSPLFLLVQCGARTELASITNGQDKDLSSCPP